MWPEWTSMLSGWQWAALAATPLAILALYFLKLKRMPLEVPSTYLWHKSIEDLHVNSLWQRLRKSLLLLLQLALIALLMLALGRPAWQTRQLAAGRLIFLIDNSASMGATDVAPSRLAEAKRRALEIVDQMGSGDVAMVVSFCDTAQVLQSFTGNRRELRRAIEAIRQTDSGTSLVEALRVASGLANPTRSIEFSDTRVSEALPATLYIFSDGRFADVKDFALGNLDPVFVPIGLPEARNVAITALGVSRRESNPDARQIFAQLENFSTAETRTDVTLHLDGELVDADELRLAAGGSGGLAFDLSEGQTGVFELRVASGGDLAIDDRAWLVINPPQRARVLLVTPGNEPLAAALRTERARELADVQLRPPAFLAAADFAAAAAAGGFDLIIFDRCRPNEPPQAAAFYIGALPAGDGWQMKETAAAPQIIDTDTAHPLLHLVELGDVLVAEGKPLVPPSGGRVLVDTSAGPMLAIAPREGFEDAVLGFELVSGDQVATNWPVRLSFPVFVLNLLEYFTGSREALAAGSVRPGQAIDLRPDTPAASVSVTPPGQSAVEVPRGKHNAFHFTETGRVGVYRVTAGGQDQGRFAVSLLDSAESNIPTRSDAELRIGHVKVAGQTGWEMGRRDLWKALVLAALAILVFEWYIYNRRVYI